LLEGVPHGLQKATEAELATLTAGVFPLPGCRPKALVTYGADRATYVLRVRNRTDDYNVPLWTQVTQTLAAACDLTVLPSCYEPISTDGVHLEPRFDRSGDKRLFCLSARTLCRRDSESHSPLSYLDVADVINAEGVRPKRDLKELFGRMVFDCLTGNVHNRPENIWFYRANGGWNLAPLSAPRVSPTLIRTRLLPMALTGNDTVADPESAVLLASYFGLSQSEAKQLVIGMQKVLFRWKDLALRLGADPIEINRMAGSFNPQ
jgi:serine/threonine-protein kinase HipA